MKKPLSFLLCIVFVVGVFPALSAAETVTCAECGMTCDTAAKFTSRIVQGDKILYYCDIGDLLTYLIKKKPQNARAEVRDYTSGEWMDAHTAFYVHDDKRFKTPMGWGIASFKNKKDASGFGTLMNFDETLKAVR
jgi:nitrous oxide reductase accessory protein NosL